MTLGTTGLTGRAASAVAGRLSFEDQVFLTRHADEAQKLVDEIKSVTQAYNEAAERHGKANQIDAVLENAKADRDTAHALIDEANEKAERITSQASARAKTTANEATAAVESERQALKAFDDEVSERANAVAQKEARIEPLHAEAEKALAEAKSAQIKAEKIRADYEGRALRLQEAIKEAGL